MYKIGYIGQFCRKYIKIRQNQRIFIENFCYLYKNNFVLAIIKIFCKFCAVILCVKVAKNCTKTHIFVFWFSGFAAG